MKMYAYMIHAWLPQDMEDTAELAALAEYIYQLVITKTPLHANEVQETFLDNLASGKDYQGGDGGGGRDRRIEATWQCIAQGRSRMCSSPSN